MADKCLANHPITSIDENGSVSHSHKSRDRRYSDGSSIPNYSRTYSHKSDHAATVESYSEIFESATRESIDETHHSKAKPSKNKEAKSRQSITWTREYTKKQIDK